MLDTIKHENLLQPNPGLNNPDYEYFEFVCRGCNMKNRYKIWNNFVNSISSDYNRNIDNSYLIFEEEVDNPYDKNAVAVVCRGEFFGTVGYVGREYTKNVKAILGKCESYRIDMVDENETNKKEIHLIITWKKLQKDKQTISEEEKQLRAQLGLPKTKQLIYMQHEADKYISHNVIGFEIVNTYMPSETHSLLIQLENEETVRILAPFFVHMQKPSFEKDMEKIEE